MLGVTREAPEGFDNGSGGVGRFGKEGEGLLRGERSAIWWTRDDRGVIGARPVWGQYICHDRYANSNLEGFTLPTP